MMSSWSTGLQRTICQKYFFPKLTEISRSNISKKGYRNIPI